MGFSTAERNRRKRERKKREREDQRKEEEAENQKSAEVAKADEDDEDEVEVEYVAEPILPANEAFDALRKFQERAAAVVVSDDDRGEYSEAKSVDIEGGHEESNEDEEDGGAVSKRKLRELLRPSVAELKRRVLRPDLVEAHDVTAADPDFLIELKAAAGTVPVPRHWGRKRKYLQGKRGFEKPPFQLPDFIIKTGITEIRDTVMEAESDMSAKQKNRSRVAPKMGAIDVDYKTLHDAFFKHQTKPANLTKFGDTYYEGKELEVQAKVQPGGPLSQKLRDALGMASESSPPPWLLNMQRYGPPPSYPSLKIPGLTAPLPTQECQYGYHPGGWGKPPIDAYGRPLYGGNPFDAPGTGSRKDTTNSALVTSDGKTIAKAQWGALPTGFVDDAEASEEESSDEDMEESSEEEEESEVTVVDGTDSVLSPPPSLTSSGPMDLRKQHGNETPMDPSAPKQLYQIIDQTKAVTSQGTVFASEMSYLVPGLQSAIPEGAESVLSKALPAGESSKRKGKDEDDDIGKNFKF
jgi:splicing factor 3B subunit 2